MSRVGDIISSLNESRNAVTEKKKTEVRCPKCNSKDIDNWEKGAYFCNQCHNEFDDKDLGINEEMEYTDSYDVKRQNLTYRGD